MVAMDFAVHHVSVFADVHMFASAYMHKLTLCYNMQQIIELNYNTRCSAMSQTFFQCLIPMDARTNDHHASWLVLDSMSKLGKAKIERIE